MRRSTRSQSKPVKTPICADCRTSIQTMKPKHLCKKTMNKYPMNFEHGQILSVVHRETRLFYPDLLAANVKA